MKQLELDLEYLTNLISLVSKIRVCTKMINWSTPYNRVVVAGGAVRDMLFNKPVNDIDVFYEGELNEDMLKQYFPKAVASVTMYPDGFNVTHNFICDMFPVKVQLIQVKNIEKHIETFPSGMMRMSVDGHGIHGMNSDVFRDAKQKMFFWDMQVDLSYFKKIKEKYSDWKHEFLEKHFNPEHVDEIEEALSMEF